MITSLTQLLPGEGRLGRARARRMARDRRDGGPAAVDGGQPEIGKKIGKKNQ